MKSLLTGVTMRDRVLSEMEREELRRLILRVGVDRAADACGLTKTTVAIAALGHAARRSTITCCRAGIQALRSELRVA